MTAHYPTLPQQHTHVGICHRCETTILISDSDEPGPIPLTGPHKLDLVLIDQATEIACVLAGRPTWQLTIGILGTWQVARRSIYWLRYHPDTPGHRPPVLPTHTCVPLPGLPLMPPAARVTPATPVDGQPLQLDLETLTDDQEAPF